jgi:hypothetical protein
MELLETTLVRVKVYGRARTEEEEWRSGSKGKEQRPK